MPFGLGRITKRQVVVAIILFFAYLLAVKSESLLYAGGLSALAVKPAPAKSKKDGAGPGKKRILVVDDNEAATNALVKLFSHLGHEARAAYNATTGIQAALDFQPHLILLDIGLPDMDGYEVVRQLRENQDFARTVIAAVSGYGQEEDRQRSREAGFDHHLVKPVDLDAWRELLGQI